MDAVGMDMLQVISINVSTKALGTADMGDSMQVGSSDSPHMITAGSLIVSDLKELGDMLAPYGFRLACEH